MRRIWIGIFVLSVNVLADVSQNEQSVLESDVRHNDRLHQLNQTIELIRAEAELHKLTLECQQNGGCGGTQQTILPLPDIDTEVDESANGEQFQQDKDSTANDSQTGVLQNLRLKAIANNHAYFYGLNGSFKKGDKVIDNWVIKKLSNSNVILTAPGHWDQIIGFSYLNSNQAGD